MMSDAFVGIDVGSISVNVVVVDQDDRILKDEYLRHKGHPMKVAAEALGAVVAEYGAERIAGLAATGNGGRAVAEVLGAPFVNEVVAQAAATARLHPEVRTVVEIGLPVVLANTSMVRAKSALPPLGAVISRCTTSPAIIWLDVMTVWSPLAT